MRTRILKVGCLALGGTSGRRRSHASWRELRLDVAVNISLNPLLLMASNGGSLAWVCGLVDQRFGGPHIHLLAIERQNQPAVFLEPCEVAQ